MTVRKQVVDSTRVPRIGPYSQAVRVGDLIFTATLNTLFAEYFPAEPPVRSSPVVTLPKGLLFSIDAIAVAGPAPR